MKQSPTQLNLNLYPFPHFWSEFKELINSVEVDTGIAITGEKNRLAIVAMVVNFVSLCLRLSE